MVKRLFLMVALGLGAASCAMRAPALQVGRVYEMTFSCTAGLGCHAERVTVAAVRHGWVVTDRGTAINLAQVLAIKPHVMPVNQTPAAPFVKVAAR